MSNTLVRRKGKIFVAPRWLPMKKATLLSRDPRGSKTGLGHPRGSAPTMTVHVDPAALWDSRRCATHQQSVRRDGLSAPPADQLWSATASGRRAAADGERTPPSREKRPRVLHKCARARPRAETATQNHENKREKPQRPPSPRNLRFTAIPPQVVEETTRRLPGRRLEGQINHGSRVFPHLGAHVRQEGDADPYGARPRHRREMT